MTRPVFQQGRSAVVLLAEDNMDHAFLMREAFEETGLRVELHQVESGDRCLAFLRRQPPYQDAPRPDLLLLDIHMPRMDGYEVMEEISRDPALRSLPVVVLSTSSERHDVRRMYSLGCASYLTKPVGFEAFAEAVRLLAAYWFGLVILPEE